MRRVKGLVLVAALAAATSIGATDRIVRVGTLTGPWEPALLDPEGRSRWELASATSVETVERRLTIVGDTVEVDEAGRARAVWRDLDGGDAAVRYLLPDRDPEGLRPGRRASFDLEVEREGAIANVRAYIETVGIGWLELLSGPREVVLQRVLLAGGAGDRIVHRWVDPRAGVVAEVEGLASADGRARLGVSRAEAVDEVVAGAADLRIYVNQFPEEADATAPYGNVLYGWNRGPGTTVASLTPQGYASAGALVDASTWDFSGNTTGTEVATTYVNVSSAQTCNYAQCGYNLPNVHLGRRDVGFGTAGLEKSNQAVEREVRATDVTIWLRAGSQKEGRSGTFGDGESRLCYVSSGSDTRSPVPLWRFSNQDAGGWFLKAGDTWQSAPFNCEQNIYNQRCGEPQFLDKLYAKACGDHTGTQFGEILRGGVVKTPSGHTFNALLARTVADFCVFTGSSCFLLLKVDEVRTVVYIWQVPYLGTVALIQGPQNGPADLRSFSTLDYTDFRTGLLPPVSISVTGRTDTSVSLSWNPGNDTRRIAGYKVYWDTDSGAAGAYAFDSVSNPGQASFSGTTATISGLAPGTRYYFTVTSLSDFTNPSTGAVDRFESLKYPTQVSGDPSFVYPVEVQDTTTGGSCIPTAEVRNLRAAKPSASFEICWDATTDPCAVGYDVVGAAVPQGPFDTIAQVGLTTCWQGNPSQKYFRVKARGTGGTGP